ncbi:hypothetical protein [Pseudalkalibacillus caeni]|uniref:Uncharacterized protein n=1 Tax=Exobacillus caeni TaxID=2574798 RepID=A0A5R9FBV3_9BACL|nr:hypothetical protein [Pseudalkalibacillus caeni]TLS38034.1 hypothetical protein FCL54_05675 [Pseudalkalibacillus caeni]
MTKGKERIRFDCVGTVAEPHVYKCPDCDHEFRDQIREGNASSFQQYKLSCPSCQAHELVAQQPETFEIVGVIECA